MSGRNKLKGSNIYISDDLTKEELLTRHEVVIYYKSLKAEGKQVLVVGSSLKIDGKLR